MSLSAAFLQSALKRVNYYRELGEKTFIQLSDADLQFRPNTESNSIAQLIRHLSGNMLSRWTDLLTSDGEKEWRNRDAEFDEQIRSKQELIAYWNKGWECFLNALKDLNEDDLLKTIHIRGESLPVVDAINRQLAHYPYHVGQIIYLGKMILNEKWVNLSIPKGDSVAYNLLIKNQKGQGSM